MAETSSPDAESPDTPDAESTDSPNFRADLDEIPHYRAGRRAKGEPGDVYSLASNEMAHGPLPGVLHASAQRMDHSHRYPDPGVTELAGALADHLGVDPSWIATGTGSVAICQQAVVAACDPGDEVLFAWRSFEAYPIITKLAGARAVQVPLLPDGRHDLAAMADAITARTRVIFLCTPNNPTGPVIRKDELESFLTRVPPSVLVVLDEAYHEFAINSAGADEISDGVEIVRANPHVLTLRTFSKAFGLAGLRVGYGVGQPPVIRALSKTSLPFGVSAVAQAAAVASLDATDVMKQRVREVVQERQRVVAQAAATGWEIPQTRANFYWIPLGDRTLEFAEACLERGVTVRAFPGEGVRVTVGEPVANDRVLAVLKEQFAR